ncbi:Rv0909 family putative TA system antitoxin [Microbacterium sp.]|uniref:Rv0909 family putative TA system antitoxin n=1 Tax=Microbacterium sp. TaxID=51671 RepID=UPI003C75A0B2
MGIDDIVNQGKEFLEQNKSKIDGVLKSDQAEDISDNVLDAAADFVKKVAPDQFDGHIDSARNAVDGVIGNK